ncbi:MAG: FtsX-like permease family protein, partial [Acidimicrobiales bacterium]
RYGNVLDYVGPNLPTNQLVLSLDGGPGAVGQIIVKPGMPQLPTPTVAQGESTAQDIAQSLGSTDVLEMETTTVLLQQNLRNGAGFNGQIYVATPAVLEHYGINPASVNPNTDLITSRAGLNAVHHLQLVNMNSLGTPQGGNCGSGFCGPSSEPQSSGVNNPTIQYLSQLPKDTSDPNVLITEHGLEQLGLAGTATPSAWIIQSARPITTFQRDSADQLAVAIGAAVEGKNSDPSLAELNNYSTAAGILLALGVLAMTVGLIRSESARDLRTLTATGATRRTRRSLTAATAGAMGLLGGLLGATIGIVGSLAFYHSKLTPLVDNIPYVNLALLIFGLPLLAAIGGYIFAGKEPKTFARMPLE